jgi:Tol biopolymer transport system component/DNA-binding winged helix-turn-helix (wHTH) protein
MRRKAYELLLFLLERNGQIVLKEELVEHLWPGQQVEESNLSQQIYQLRTLLSVGTPPVEYIRTYPRVGYSFDQPIIILDPEEVPSGPVEIPSGQFVDDTGSLEESSRHLPPAPDDGLKGAGPPTFEEPTPSKSPVSTPQPLRVKQRGEALFSTRVIKHVAVLLSLLMVTIIGIMTIRNTLRDSDNRPVSDRSTPLINPFTTLSGVEEHPAYSPDGKLIAFNNEGAALDNHDIYVKLSSEGDALRITSHLDDELKPTWSPDSRELAFLRKSKDPDSKSQVIIIPALGGSERFVTEARDGLDWSPISQQLAIADQERPGAPMAIFLVDTDGANRRQATNPDASLRYEDNHPKFSPDGSRIAFIRKSGSSSSDLYIVDLESGRETALTKDQAQLTSFDWSPTGEQIYFVSNRKVNQRLWVVDVRIGRVRLVKGLPIDLDHISISPDRRSLAYSRSTIDTIIDLASLPISLGSNLKPICKINSSRGDESPRFSPDGSRLVYTSNRNGFTELWLSTSDCSRNVPLTNFTDGEVGSPRWSPDGSAIVFDRGEGGRSNIYRIQVDGTGLQKLTANSFDDMMPSWSPDGKLIYFTSTRDGQRRIWQIPSTGGTATPLTLGDAFEALPSPDGTTLYFTRKGRIWQKRLPTGEEEQIRELAHLLISRYWTVDQSSLYFVTKESGQKPKINQFLFSTRQIIPLGEVPGFLLPTLPGISVHEKTGQMAIAYIQYRVGDIMVASNWE